VFGVIAPATAAASPYGTTRKPGVKGANPSRYCASVEKLTMVTVRPWKLLAQTMISACPSGIPLAVYPHFLAALTAVSTASAPEFIGSAMSYPVRSCRSL